MPGAGAPVGARGEESSAPISAPLKDAGQIARRLCRGRLAFADVASYFTITSVRRIRDLRDLQEPEALDLLARIRGARRGAGSAARLKIAPDLTPAQLDAIVRAARDRRIDGMIVSNTTISRPVTLRSHFAKESGGLSGAPLFDLSTRVLAQTFLRVEEQFPLIGVGGVDSAETALAKIEAGATLVQLYSALVYEGPGLVARIKRGLIETLSRGKEALAARIGKCATTSCRAE
jgi:dihydroorotate dehydrogenase